jgi:RHS repeat-associated protein
MAGLENIGSNPNMDYAIAQMNSVGRPNIHPQVAAQQRYASFKSRVQTAVISVHDAQTQLQTGRWLAQEQLNMPEDQYLDGMNLYQYVRSNPINYVDPYGLCAIREYMEHPLVGGGIPHKGILVGLNTDYDFGPGVSWMPGLVPGVCPWPFGGPTWGSTVTWDLEIKKTSEKIKYGHPDRPLCCCATCGDVQKCVRRTCAEWNGTGFWPWRNCWSFVSAAKSNCCLKRK